MRTDLHVRVATPEDVDAWRALRLDGTLSDPSAFLVTPQEAQALSVEIDMRHLSTGNRFLAFRDGHPIGLIGLNPNTIPRARHRAEIGPFYVVPDARGLGVADGLMDALSARARATGIWQLELYVNKDNARAIAFYSRHGFGEVGRIPNAIMAAQGAETDIIMIRTAPPATRPRD